MRAFESPCQPEVCVSNAFRVLMEVITLRVVAEPTLCDAMDGSLPGSPVPGILQARVLEWVAISLSNA